MYELKSKVRYSEVDLQAKMTWVALLDYFQDCCVFQSEALGIGIDYLLKDNRAWVLSSIQVKCIRMPDLMEDITVQTWPYGMKGFWGYRNFKVLDGNGNCIAYANSSWVHMDTETGRPVKIPKEISDKYEMLPAIEMECSERKITLPGEYEQKESFLVPSYFIDTNNHMNNSKYVLVASKYIPDSFIIEETRVEYKKSAVYSDVMIPRVTYGDNGRITVALVGEDDTVYAVVQFIGKDN